MTHPNLLHLGRSCAKWRAGTLLVATLLLLAGGALTTPGNGSMAFGAPKLPPPVLLPSKVVDLRAAAVSDTSVALTWTEVPSGNTTIGRYAIRGDSLGRFAWGTAPDMCGTPVVGSSAAGGKVRSCVVTGLKPGATYQFQVIAFTGTWGTATNLGPLSNVVTVTTAGRYGPLTVTGPLPTDSVFIETMTATGYPGWTRGRYPVRGWAPLGLTTLTGYLGDSVQVRGYLFVVRP